MATGVTSAEAAMPAAEGQQDAIDIISGDMEVELNGPASFNDRLVLRQGDRQFGADGGDTEKSLLTYCCSTIPLLAVPNCTLKV